MLYNGLKDGIYILHENPEWIAPFKEAFERAEIPFEELILTKGSINLDIAPPQGVFWSRMSASSHTRDHTHSKEYARAVLSWLQTHNRRVINGLNVLEFEVSKVAQYLALNQTGFRTPKTLAVFGKEDLLSRAKELKTPFISKHNQGGKGLGVRRFDSLEDFKTYIDSEEFEEPIDGITLLQEYIVSKEFYITRAEFIDSKFHYAVKVDTSAGSFELCPADACNVNETSKIPELAGAMCDIGGAEKFSLREDINENTALIIQLENFLKAHKIEVAGVEFIEDINNEFVVYDINTNTNYNKVVESQAKMRAADKIVEFLHREFKKVKG